MENITEQCETNVLEAVETLFQKLESATDDVRRQVLTRIQQKLIPVNTTNKAVDVGQVCDSKSDNVATQNIEKDSVHEADDDVLVITVIKEEKSESFSKDGVTSPRRATRAKRIDYVSLVGGKRNFVESADNAGGPPKRGRGRPRKQSLLSESAKKEVAVPIEQEFEAVLLSDCQEVTSTSHDDDDDAEKLPEFVAKELPESSESNCDGKEKIGEVPIARKPEKPKQKRATCTDCGAVLSSASMLRIHMRKHLNIKPYVCPECGKAFRQSSGLNIHLKRHRGQRDYPCDFCDYRAFAKIDLIRHFTIHTGERNQVCEYCGKAFAKDSTLREHVRSIHEKSKKHICAECGFVTYRANNLRVHIQMRHRGEYNNHICPVCGARVKQKNAFLEHMRSHTGERPFQCEQCDSSFACLARLTVHVKSVHFPRQHQCNSCDKMFQTKHHLLRHKVVHTKDRPYSCLYCSYSCNTQGNITKHIKSIHNKPDFSYRRYRLQKENSTVDSSSVSNDPEWVVKGQKVTERYLNDLSEKLGRPITVEELKQREEERREKIKEEMEQARSKRLRRIRLPEHSYTTVLSEKSTAQMYTVKKVNGVNKEHVITVFSNGSPAEGPQTLMQPQARLIQLKAEVEEEPFHTLILQEAEGENSDAGENVVHSENDERSREYYQFLTEDKSQSNEDSDDRGVPVSHCEVLVSENEEAITLVGSEDRTDEVQNAEDDSQEIQGFIWRDGIFVPVTSELGSEYDHTVVVIINQGENEVVAAQDSNENSAE